MESCFTSKIFDRHETHGAPCRHAEFEHYKASRPPTAEAIKKAVPEVQAMMKVGASNAAVSICVSGMLLANMHVPAHAAAQRLSMPEPAWLLQVFGMCALCISGFEADDLIGTLVNRATSEGMAVVLISPDKVSLLAATMFHPTKGPQSVPAVRYLALDECAASHSMPERCCT